MQGRRGVYGAATGRLRNTGSGGYPRQAGARKTAAKKQCVQGACKVATTKKVA